MIRVQFLQSALLPWPLFYRALVVFLVCYLDLLCSLASLKPQLMQKYLLDDPTLASSLLGHC